MLENVPVSNEVERVRARALRNTLVPGFLYCVAPKSENVHVHTYPTQEM